MLNPHQNININISYNLSGDKISKPLPAKKIQKHNKTQTSQPTIPGDIDIKLNRKNGENNLRKSNQYKAGNEPKRHKKSRNVPVRNIQTPDMFADRRIKTEGPTGQNDLLSAFKKDKTHQKHHKSIQVPIGKVSQSTKKTHSQPKIPKSKAGHVTSCTMPNWKKTALQFGDHAISQVIQPKKKRTQSHSTFIKNDKVVTKLLNMSMLASELGGSQPITSQRKANSSNHSRNLKWYMSSMDMRIIRCMQEDVPVFADQKEKGQPDLIRVILMTNGISLEDLTRKASKIQRAWRRYKEKSKSQVINQYQKMFQQIAAKLRNEKLADISDIAVSPDNFEDDNPIFENEGLAACINKERFVLPGSSFEEDSFSETQNMKWISEQKSASLNQTNQLQLNFPKYRELVSNQLQKRTKKPNQKQKFKEEQQEQWNSVNKKISNAMNFTTNLDTQLINDELFRQSKINQDWINNQFQENSRDIDGFIDDVMGEKKENDASHSQDEFQSCFEPPLEREVRERPYEDSLEEEEYNQYDKTKYETVNEQLPPQVLTPSEPFSLKIENEPIPMQMQMDYEPPSHNNHPIDQVWISQNLMEDNVVRNYLDCGLNDFGINLNSRIMQVPELSHEGGEFQNAQVSSDEAIGVRFQEANFGIMSRSQQEVRGEVHEEDPEFKKELQQENVDNVVEDTIQFLISQFASDISVILKKSTGQPPVQKKQPPRVQGIPTNYSAITQYLTKFIDFILRESSSVQKVVDTINKDIGPSSLEILTYLRPESEDSMIPSMEPEQQSMEEDDGLFVVPADIYEQFQNELEESYRAENQKQMGPRMKAYYSFWHRCIFQSYNECLDYQRPYGVEGKPYEWTTETKVFRAIKKQKLVAHLHKAEHRLLDLTSLVGGIIFQKSDSPFSPAEFTEQQKHMMNEERLSRILATELLESEESWINYNDEMAELLVELSRMIEDKLFFEHGTELKKLQRRRKMVAQESLVEQTVSFNIDQL